MLDIYVKHGQSYKTAAAASNQKSINNVNMEVSAASASVTSLMKTSFKQTNDGLN